jgi:PST family polysaccharide transporter
MSGIKKKFAVGSIWLFIGQNISNLAGFIIFAVLARILGPLEFGIVAFASVFIDLSRSFALAGLPAALIRAPEWDDVAASTSFWGNVGFAIVLIVAVGVVGGFIAGQYYGEQLQWVISALSVCLFIDALRATHEAKLQREFQYKSLAKRTAVATIGAGIAGIALAFAGFGVWALVINRIANATTQTLITWRATPWTPTLSFRWDKFKAMFMFGIHLSAAALFGQISRRVPELFAGLLINPVAVGFYRVGARMVNILFDLTITPLQRIAMPGFARLDDTAARVRGFRIVTRFVGLFAFPAFFGMAALANDLVVLVFGQKWAESGYILSMLALVGGVASVSYFVQPLLATTGHAHIGAIRSFQLLIVNIVVCMFAAPFGAEVLAMAFAARAYVGVIPTLLLLKRAVGLPPSKVLRDTLPSVLCATVMLLIVLAVRVYVLTDYSRLLSIIILVPLGAIVYVSTFVVLFRTVLWEIWHDVEPLFIPARQWLSKR